MSNSFSDLKRSRKSLHDKIIEETNKLQNNTQSGGDDRFWQPQVDKAGNGYAVIRFLPAPQGEDLPWVRVFSHGFQGPGGWYIENSLTTIGKDDPLSEFNSSLWNRGDEAGKEQARKQKRRLTYISNVYVVKDSANPDNEGKVFLYKYGKKIWDKINDVMHPQFDDEEPIIPFDMWEGANFKLKIRNVEGYRNYDKSEFDSPGPLSDDDDELEAIWKKESSLTEFTDPKNFKSYAELKARLHRVLGEVAVTANVNDVEEEEYKAPPRSESRSESVDDDDDLAFFKKLAEEEA